MSDNEIIDLPLTGFPTLKELFDEFDALLFDSQLKHWTIGWSGRMKTSAGLCEPGKRSIRISSVIHQYRSLKELRETILHEMIHAHLHQQGVQGESPHGPSFQKMAKFLGEITQLTITTYHHFFEEVQEARRHYVWSCAVCGFEKHGRTKPSMKKHNLLCSGKIVQRAAAAAAGIAVSASLPDRQGGIDKGRSPDSRSRFAGPGVMLGRGENHDPVTRARLKAAWLHSFDEVLPASGHLTFSDVLTEARRCAEVYDNHVFARKSAGGSSNDFSLEQSMLTKGLLFSPEPYLSQWDD